MLQQHLQAQTNRNTLQPSVRLFHNGKRLNVWAVRTRLSLVSMKWSVMGKSHVLCAPMNELSSCFLVVCDAFHCFPHPLLQTLLAPVSLHLSGNSLFSTFTPTALPACRCDSGLLCPLTPLLWWCWVQFTHVSALGTAGNRTFFLPWFNNFF